MHTQTHKTYTKFTTENFLFCNCNTVTLIQILHVIFSTHYLQTFLCLGGKTLLQQHSTLRKWRARAQCSTVTYCFGSYRPGHASNTMLKKVHRQQQNLDYSKALQPLLQQGTVPLPLTWNKAFIRTRLHMLIFFPIVGQAICLYYYKSQNHSLAFWKIHYQLDCINNSSFF